MHTRTGRNRDADQQFVGARTVRDGEGHGGIVRADVELVLVGKRDVDGRAGRGNLAGRRYPGLAAAYLLTKRVAERRGDAGHDMFLRACGACDTTLAITLDRPVAQQGRGTLAKRMADRRAGFDEVRQVGDELPGEGIAYDLADRGLDETDARCSAVVADIVNGGIPAPYVVVFLNFHRIVQSCLP